MKLFKHIVCFLILFIATSIQAVNAASAFYDDFEDGDHLGWLESTTGGSGSIGVQEHNGSEMAFVKHLGSGSHSVSQTVNYFSDDSLGFEIQAIAIKHGGGNNVTLNSGCGVTISFLDTWNVLIEDVSFTNLTNINSLGSGDYYIGTEQYSYDAKMSEFAEIAGLSDTGDISKVNINFWSWATQHSYSGYTDNSSATVWFDNVTISTSAVPIPGAIWLLSFGFISLIGYRTRFKK